MVIKHSFNFLFIFVKRWYELRSSAEQFYGIPINESPCRRTNKGRKYQPMAFDQIDLKKAVALSTHHYVPDGSPDRLIPIGNTGYVSDVYF